MTFASTCRRHEGRSIMGLSTKLVSTKLLGAAFLWMAAIAGVLSCGAAQQGLAAEPTDLWPGLARDIFNGRQLADG